MSQTYATGASRQDEDLRRRIPDHQANGSFKFPTDEKDDKKTAKVRAIDPVFTLTYSRMASF